MWFKQTNGSTTRNLKVKIGSSFGMALMQNGYLCLERQESIDYISSIRFKKKYGIEFIAIPDGEVPKIEPRPKSAQKNEISTLLNINPVIQSKPVIPKRVDNFKGKRLFYTALYGDYDVLKEIPKTMENYHAICFTDNPEIKTKTWKVVNFKYRPTGKTNSRFYARFIKTQIHKIYPLYEYQYVIWIDANARLKKDIQFLLEDMNDKCLSVFGHGDRNCLYDCAEVVVKFGKSDGKLVSKQLEKYMGESMPKHYGLWATHLLMWKPCQVMYNFLDLWYGQIKEYSIRDQVSFPYLLWKTKLPMRTIMNSCLYEAKWHEFVGLTTHESNK